MKFKIFIVSILLSSSLYSQNGWRTITFRGELKGMKFQSQIDYMVDCTLGTIFVRATLRDVEVYEFVYQGTTYRNKINNLEFPFKIKGGYLDLGGSIQLSNYSNIQSFNLKKSQLSIGMSGKGGAMFADQFRFSTVEQTSLKNFFKIKTCDELKVKAMNNTRQLEVKILKGNFMYNNTSLNLLLSSLIKKEEKSSFKPNTYTTESQFTKISNITTEEKKTATPKAKITDNQNTNTSKNKTEEKSIASTKKEYVNNTQVNKIAKKQALEQEAREKILKEQEKKRKAEKERLKRKAAYDERIKQANKENQAIAAASATTTLSTFILVGSLIYKDMGAIKNSKIYSGSNSIFYGFDIGYSVSSTPIYFNSTEESNNGNNTTYKTELQNNGALTLNLSPTFKFGYETVIKNSFNLYGYGFGGIDLGLSPFFIAFNTSYRYGGRYGLGLKNIKFFGEHNIGNKNFEINDWIDVQETGSGKSKIEYTNNTYGIQFSWYSRYNSPGRKHLYLGIIKEKFKKDDVYSIQFIDAESSSHRFATDRSKEQEYTGYMIEYKHDHHSKFNLQVFSGYPYTGKKEFRNISEYLSEKTDGGWFVRISYTKSIDSFFNF